MIDKARLLRDLVDAYRRTHRESEKFFLKANRHLVKGGSHNLRLFDPFPFYDRLCRGSTVIDVDENIYVDFWQGHFANILGHNPRPVLDALLDFFRRGQGLATGFPGILQAELAELLLSRIPADRIRFTTSGTLATMYAVMLAKAKTGREMVMKVGGGWHGSQPYTLKGISSYEKDGFTRMESAGLPGGVEKSTLVTRFNDLDDLREKWRTYGERTACLILEPFIGAGGFIFAAPDYLREARKLTRDSGALLILDEVVSGFRFHAGPLHTLYGVTPDLSVFGKAIGGGMPLSAITGKEEVMELCGSGPQEELKVKCEGGTFSAHPASMLAGITYIRYLVEHQEDIYPRIGSQGDLVREEIEKIFRSRGFLVRCTGKRNSIVRHSSVVGVHFLHQDCDRITFPDQVWNPAVCDVELREKHFKLAMLEEGFNVFHGYGAISTAHSDQEIQASLEAVERIAGKWKTYTKTAGK